jgi:hypothetical protein
MVSDEVELTPAEIFEAKMASIKMEDWQGGSQ